MIDGFVIELPAEREDASHSEAEPRRLKTGQPMNNVLR